MIMRVILFLYFSFFTLFIVGKNINNIMPFFYNPVKEEKLYAILADKVQKVLEMGPSRFELETSALSRRRHNQLDYGPFISFCVFLFKVLPKRLPKERRAVSLTSTGIYSPCRKEGRKLPHDAIRVEVNLMFFIFRILFVRKLSSSVRFSTFTLRIMSHSP